MSTTATTTVTSLDGFHATPTAQRADELARAFFDAVNADDPARTDAVLARSFLSYDVHSTRSRTGLERNHSDLRRAVLFYATNDDDAATTFERLIRAAGFDPFKASGIEARWTDRGARRRRPPVRPERPARRSRPSTRRPRSGRVT